MPPSDDEDDDDEEEEEEQEQGDFYWDKSKYQNDDNYLGEDVFRVEAIRRARQAKAPCRAAFRPHPAPWRALSLARHLFAPWPSRMQVNASTTA